MRWQNYFHRSGESVNIFWKKYLQANEKNVLFVLGLGFDPRVCFGFEAFLKAEGKGTRDIMIINLEEGHTSPSKKYSELIMNNKKTIENLSPKDSETINKKVPMWSNDKRRIGSRNAANIFKKTLPEYDDIIIDISAMPKGIYFPLIGKVLYLIDSKKAKGDLLRTPNLHIVVSENAQLDARINDEGIDEDASYMHGFTGYLESETSDNLPKVWIPILGEKQQPQLERIHNLISPNEICPILPMPSSDPRRGDNLTIEYQDLLFDRLNIELRNIIYASEQNPFQVYRQIHQTIQHYQKALKTLGGCQTVVSTMSSKLLSIGALLAVYELKNKGDVGIAHVETQGYKIEGNINIKEEYSKSKLNTLFIAGDCYDQ